MNHAEFYEGVQVEEFERDSCGYEKIFNSDQVYLTFDLFRKACKKMALILDKELPREGDLNYIYHGIKNVTINEISLACRKIVTSFNQKFFPDLHTFKNALILVNDELRERKAVEKSKLIDYPNQADWHKCIWNRIKDYQAKSGVKVSHSTEQEIMRKQVERMRMLRQMYKVELLEFYCTVKVNNCEHYNYCRQNKHFCKNVKNFIHHFKKD